MNNLGFLAAITAVISLVSWTVAAWVTHVIVCFTAGSWGFLIAGALLAPVAVAHGTWVWFQ